MERKARKMRALTAAVLAMALAGTGASAAVIVTGILDGTLTGGAPKAIELYVDGTADLSNYRLERSANGGAWSSVIDPLAGAYTDGYAYLVGSAGNGLADFQAVFGNAGDFANVAVVHGNGNVSGNGNDGFRLVNTTSNVVVDQVWQQDATDAYRDSFLYRANGTGPDGGTWTPANWSGPGNDALDGLTAAQIAAAVPFGTYQPPAPKFLPPHDRTVAINEVDYDNPGADRSEWVELVGRAGTNLTGWTLRLVNGANGQTYADWELQGEIPHDFTSEWGGKGGFFVVGAFDPAAAAAFGAPDFAPTTWTGDELQNGPNDIIELYDEHGHLVDRWEYESSTPGTPGSAFDAFDSNSGTDQDVSTYGSIGRRGWDNDEPLFVFDDAADFDSDGRRLHEEVFPDDSQANLILAGLGPRGAYTEAGGSEIFWSGTSGAGAGRGISPGTFNNASYGAAGRQDEYTINIQRAPVVPEPATVFALVAGLAGAAGYLRRRT